MSLAEDEEFARSYRPEGGAFGSLGAQDSFEGEDEPAVASYQQQARYVPQPPRYADPRTPIAGPSRGGFAGPMAVSGPFDPDDPGYLGEDVADESTGAGITLLWLVAGGVAGYYYGRDIQRTLGGVLSAGGARNLYRSFYSQSATGDKVRMGAIGLGGLGVGVALLLGAFDKK